LTYSNANFKNGAERTGKTANVNAENGCMMPPTVSGLRFILSTAVF